MHNQENSIRKICGTCSRHEEEPICYECAGENYGNVTEISEFFTCSNWEGEGNDNRH